MKTATSTTPRGNRIATAGLVASSPIFGDWICTPVTEGNRERLIELTGMPASRLKEQKWLTLRREGNGAGTRYYLYKTDLIAALETLPRD